jgi:RNA polymerase sigma-70 factor (ECF subfamily)
VLPAGLGAPEPDPAAAPVLADAGVSWLQPLPDALVSLDTADPAAILVHRESLRLALIASLQYLSGTERAVLMLRDVLAFPAAEVAKMLGTTSTAVKSTLQRARGRLRERAPAADDITPPTDPAARAFLDQYIEAFQNSDAPALERLLCRDATLEAVPIKTWFAGRATCIPYLRDQLLGTPGFWRMLPTSANGQPAAAAYTLAADGSYRAYGLVVLSTTAAGISQIFCFQQPDLLALCGLPPSLAGSRPERAGPDPTESR